MLTVAHCRSNAFSRVSPAGRSTSHLELFAMGTHDRISAPDAAAPSQHELMAALTEKVVAKIVEAKQQEVVDMMSGMAAKYGLAANYGKAEETIKAVWAEQVGQQHNGPALPCCCNVC